MSAVESEIVDPDDGARPEDRVPSSDRDDRRDRAVAAVGFFAWLHKYADERFEPLKELLGREVQRKIVGPQFRREKIAAYFEYDETLLELLTKAEMEWRADRTAKESLQTHMEIDTSPSFDFRSPTMSKASKCRYAGPKGGLCGKPSVPGTVRCPDHGGELVDATTRQAILMTSYLQIVEATSVAVDALVSVAKDSRNDLARVAAAKEILDRAGLTAELKISVNIEGDERNDKINRLKEKLDAMQRGLQTKAIDAVARDVPIVDADVVEVPA